MHGLDNRGQFHQLFIDGLVAGPTAKENQRRANTLSARIDAVCHVFSNLLLEAIDLILQITVQLRQVRFEEIE